MDCLIEVSQLWTLDSAVYGPCLVWLLGQLMQILGGLSAIYKLHLQQRAACRLAGSSKCRWHSRHQPPPPHRPAGHFLVLSPYMHARL